ncbi:MAG: decaprenyl-phosphate phosphoribosyltransferase [Thermodesulforhabdaceae bacterium]
MFYKLLPYVKLIRPVHWIKNGLVFAPIFFGKKLFVWQTFLCGIKAFALFSLVASGIYILNDLHDRHRDKYHPQKANRPLASGAVSTSTALFMSGILLISGVGLGFAFNKQLAVLIVVYILLSEAYSLKLKHIAPLDAICVAMGYLLRILAGSVASGIETSRWLFLTSFFVALFIALAKRLGELNIEDNTSHRPVLQSYSSGYLLAATSATASASLVTFALYTVEKGHHDLVYAVIPASYGILRYLLTITTRKGSEPIQIFLKDPQLQVATFVLLTVMGWIIYR